MPCFKSLLPGSTRAEIKLDTMFAFEITARDARGKQQHSSCQNPHRSLYFAQQSAVRVCARALHRNALKRN